MDRVRYVSAIYSPNLCNKVYLFIVSHRKSLEIIISNSLWLKDCHNTYVI